MSATKPQLTAKDIIERLHAKFPAPKFASFAEVSDGTGYDVRRRIDFVAVAAWPSAGDRIVAVEVKVSRADYMREIEDPSKREWWREHSTDFWFATPPGLISPEELPEGCGLFETRGKSVAVKRAASQGTATVDLRLLRTFARRSAEGTAKLQALHDPFATFEGREVSLLDLEQIVAKATHEERETAAKARVDAFAVKASALEKARAEIAPKARIIKAAERFARTVDPSVGYRSEPARIVAALEAAGSMAGIGDLAAKLREIAEQIDAASGEAPQ